MSWIALLALSSLYAPVFSTPTSRAVTGDKTCNWLLCVEATLNDQTLQYTLTSTGKEKVGWMALGRGTWMGDSSDMVVMWTNPDGTVTLSQRTTDAERMPTVDPAPAKVATLSVSSSFVRGNQTAMSYTVPYDGEHRQRIIWAYGSETPPSSKVDEDILIHRSSGNFIMDVSTVLDPAPESAKPSEPTSTPSSQPAKTDPTEVSPPSWHDFKMVIAHAVFSTVGFLVLLPGGVLLARYCRNTNPLWFKYHWIMQFAVAEPVITLGVAFGVYLIVAKNKTHFHGKHTKYGAFLFLLFLAQCALGAIIHFVKPKNKTRRPIQNYLHAIVGLCIIGLAFYQVRGGYRHAWSHYTKLPALPDDVDVLWWCWVIATPVMYLGGLAYLPKQLAQEKESSNAAEELPYKYVPLDDMRGVPDGDGFQDNGDVEESSFRDIPVTPVSNGRHN